MSAHNAALARTLLDLWSRRDVDAVLELLHEDIEWHPALTVGGLEGSVYRGHDDIRRWLRKLDDAWAERKYEVEEVRDLGEERVLMLGHFHAVGRESHVPIDQPQGFVSRFKGGRLAFARAFASHEQAIEAAGLRG
jgi:ketosteroid isomerase-like protein